MALSATRRITQIAGTPHPNYFEIPVAASTTIYQGGMVCKDSAGRAVPASATSGLSAVMGVAAETADNSTGGAGAINVLVRPGTFYMTNSGTSLAIADRYSVVYAVDDEAVAKASTGGRPIAGILIEIDSALGAAVLMSPAFVAGVASVATSAPLYHVRGASAANVANLAAFTVANDGITFVATERVLLKNQNTASQNGIYTVGTVAAGVAPLTRALDFDDSTEILPNSVVVVAEGTLGADTAWEITADAPIVVGTTNLTFAQVPWGYGAASAMTAITPDVAASAGTSTLAARIDHVHATACAATAANSVNPGNVAAEGASSSFARADHVHPFECSAPAANSVQPGNVAAEGNASTAARSNHVHPFTCAAPAAGSVAPGNAAAEGSATTGARSDHVHPFTCAAPAAAAVQPGNVAAEGAATTGARSDHVHAITCAAAGTVAVGDAAAEGAATSFARSDHTHAVTAPAAPANVTKAAAAAGASANVARQDHKHDIDTAAAGAITGSAGEGAATSLARSDHDHSYGSGSIPATAPAAEAAAGIGIQLFIRHDLPAGGGGADDVEIYNASTPFNLRILDTFMIVTGAGAGGSTCTVRDTAGGGGAALSSALSSAATGYARNAAAPTATPDLAAGSSIYVRRTDNTMSGEIVLLCTRY